MNSGDTLLHLSTVVRAELRELDAFAALERARDAYKRASTAHETAVDDVARSWNRFGVELARERGLCVCRGAKIVARDPNRDTWPDGTTDGAIYRVEWLRVVNLDDGDPKSIPADEAERFGFWVPVAECRLVGTAGGPLVRCNLWRGGWRPYNRDAGDPDLFDDVPTGGDD